MKMLGGTSFAESEEAALAVLNELGRVWLRTQLQAVAEGIPDQVVVDGLRYRRHEMGRGTYHSLCGPVEVHRDTFRRMGVHNGPTIVPMDLIAGIVEGATPAFAFSAAQGYAAMPLRHYEAELRAAHRVPPCRSTLERLAKRLGDAVRAALPTVEPIVRDAEHVPDDAVAISIGLDRTTVPMAEARDERLPARPRRGRTRPYQRQPPAPVDVTYRMAYVGTVAMVGADGETVRSRRFGASAEEGPEAVVARVFAEVEHLRRHRPDLPLVVIQDGAPELWRLLRAACEQHGVKPALEMIDRFHLDERLAAILELVAASDHCAATLRARWATSLDRSDTAIDRIVRELDGIDARITDSPWLDHRGFRSSLAHHLRKHVANGKTGELHGHIEYLRNNRRRMRYASARRAGFPVGSGVTEGACKSLIACRFKRSGQRWFEQGLSACLSLRALHLNEHLAPCFRLVAASYSRAVTAA
jgi:hypothetical protein